MKKHLKTIMSLFLAMVLFTTSLTAGSVSAFAAEKLGKNIVYDYFGTAFVTITPGNSDNYVTYTTDGTIPSADSEKYTGEITVYEETYFRVAEYTPEGDKVKGIKFTVKPKLAPVTFKVKQLGDKAEVTLSCLTDGAEIRYTTDGTKPSQDSQLYTDKLVITEKTKIRARAYCDGYKTVTTYAKTVKITPAEELEAEKEEEAQEAAATDDKKETDNSDESTDKDVSTENKPSAEEIEAAEEAASKEKVVDNQKIGYKFTYMDNGRTYVTLTPAKNGYTIRYTTDGTAPSKNSKKYSSRVKFEEPGVLRARQYNSKGQCVGTIKLTVKIKCAEVEYTCVSMDTGIREIKMTCATPGVTIYYTTNGTTPRNNDKARIYTGPVFVNEFADLMAYATKDGYKDGSITWEIAGRISMPLDDFDFNSYNIQASAELLNTYRLANGCPTLILDEDLSKAACLRAKEISIYFDNKRPSGLSYGSAASEYGVSYTLIGEFIERSHENPVNFINAILDDQANRTHLLSSTYEYDRIGVGYYKTPNGGEYWVLLVVKD